MRTRLNGVRFEDYYVVDGSIERRVGSVDEEVEGG
jgi:hypothetical protein